MFQVLYNVQGSVSNTGEGLTSITQDYTGSVRLLWYELIPNLVLSVLIAFSLVFLITKFRSEASLRKELSTKY